MKSAEINFRHPKVYTVFAYAVILTAVAAIVSHPIRTKFWGMIQEGLKWGADSYGEIFRWICGAFILGCAVFVLKHVFQMLRRVSVDEWGAKFIQLLGLGLIFVPQMYAEGILFQVGAIFLFIGLFIGLSPKKQIKRNEIKDELFRGYFAQRIGENLRSKKPTMRRIAIRAPWGEGKSTLLRLIRQDLETKNGTNDIRFRCAWVNPWKASSPEEAHQAIAYAINEALDETSLIPFGWQRQRFVKPFIDKLQNKTAGALFLDAVKAYFPDNAKEYLGKIDRRIDFKNERVVVFVDDMERADPFVVRSMLPVIDSLADLKNVFFIFAIDPDRLADAYNSGPNRITRWQAKTLANGYLDKVMDLQVGIENPTATETAVWMKNRIKKIKEECRKLYSVFDSLTTHLPRNPRCCERFFNLAVQTETMFLNEYEDKEHDYFALFLCLRLEAQFQGFFDFLKGNWNLFHEVGINCIMEKEKWKNGKEIEKLFSSLETSFSDVIYEAKGAIESFCSRYEIFGDFFDTYEVKWLCGGFRSRRHLNSKDLIKVLRNWNKRSQSASFADVIQSAVKQEGIPSHMQECVIQVFDKLMSEISKSLRNYQNEDKVQYLENAESMLKAIAWHFGSGITSLDEYDVFLVSNSDTIKSWVEGMINLITLMPIENNGQYDNIRSARMEAFRRLLNSVPYESTAYPMYHLFRGMRNVGRPYSDPKYADICHHEIDEVEFRYKTDVCNKFFKRLSESNWRECGQTFSKSGILVTIENPLNWIPYDNKKELIFDIFDLALNETTNRSALIQNAREIVSYYFMKPYIKDASRESYNQEFLSQKPYMVEYVKKWWLMACNQSKCETSIDELKGLKQQMIKSPKAFGDTMLTRTQIESMFPDQRGES